MTRDEIFSVIQEIIRDEIGNCLLIIGEDMTALDVEGWDSLTHMSIISAIEKRFQLIFSFIDIVNLEKISDLVNLVQNKLSLLGTKCQ